MYEVSIMKSNNRKYIKNMIAGVLVACIALADISLAARISSQVDCVEVEEHDLETYLADGNYNGNDSDSEVSDEQIVELSTGKSLFNILEILPTVKKASIGYTIGGCEPFEDAKGIKSGNEYIVTPQQMRGAYMDAMFNKEPGSAGANDNNNLDNFPLAKRFHQDLSGAFSDGGIAPFKWDAGLHSGYYKYIGENKGVYALKKNESGNIVKDEKGNPIFRSKFYFGSGNYDYIYVDGKTSSNTDTDYNVTDQKRINYTNNEKFLKEAYGLNTDAAVKTWKEDHVIEVTTRTPESVSYEDIERADVIILNNATTATMRYYTNALQINNVLHGRDENTDIGVSFADIDFDDFEKVIRIYERVAVREDVAFIGSRTNVSGMLFDTGVRKLMCMLFYVYREDDTRPGSGRKFFMNFIKRYASDRGDYRRGEGESPLKYVKLQEEYYAHKDETKKKGNDPYPDYRAPALVKNSYYYDSQGKVSMPYSHYYLYSPGHPLVHSREEAITGGHYDENGYLVPEHDMNKMKDREMKRRDKTMYENDKLSYWTINDSNGYNYRAKTWQSMSNTTDYIYIDNDGNLVRDDKYSGYWFQIDDDGNGDHQYKRIKWNKETNKTWPWVEAPNDFKYWLFHESTTEYKNGYWEKGNLHLWYDMHEGWLGDDFKFRASNVISGGSVFENQAIEAENGLLKSGLINSTITSRKFEREKYDPMHVVEKDKEDYYISMNILNGDGVNEKAATKNKTLYYNEYEKSSIEAKQSDSNTTYIPIKIRIKSSDRLNEINIYNQIKEGGSYTNKLLVTYNLNTDVGTEVINSSGSIISDYFQGKASHAKARTLTLTPNNEIDPDSDLPKLLTSSSKKPIYTYEGTIYAELSDIYLANHNTKFVVELSAEKPGGNTGDSSDDVKISDEIMIVRRDFFALD